MAWNQVHNIYEKTWNRPQIPPQGFVFPCGLFVVVLLLLFGTLTDMMGQAWVSALKPLRVYIYYPRRTHTTRKEETSRRSRSGSGGQYMSPSVECSTQKHAYFVFGTLRYRYTWIHAPSTWAPRTVVDGLDLSGNMSCALTVPHKFEYIVFLCCICSIPCGVVGVTVVNVVVGLMREY